MALAFVRAFKPDASTILKYSMYHLAYSVEEELKPSPPSDNGSGASPNAAALNEEQPSKDPRLTTKLGIGEDPTNASPPKKRLKKQPRQCTIADPFVFNEDDGIFADEDAATPPMFGKHISRSKSMRSPLVDAANKKRLAPASAGRKKKETNTAPKQPLVLTSTALLKRQSVEAPTPNLSPQLSATPTSKPVKNRPKFVVASVADGPTPSPPPARPKRAREGTKQPWWVVQTH
jgi:hypothetical protein